MKIQLFEETRPQFSEYLLKRKQIVFLLFSITKVNGDDSDVNNFVNELF